MGEAEMNNPVFNLDFNVPMLPAVLVFANSLLHTRLDQLWWRQDMQMK